MSDIVAQLATSERLQRVAHDRLPLELKRNELAQRIDAAEADFARLQPSAQRDQGAANLIGMSHEIWRLGNEAAALVRESTSLAQRLERELDALESDAAQWRTNLPILREGKVPAQVLDGAQSMAQQVQTAADHLRDARDRALLELVRAQALQAAISTAMSRIAAGTEQILARRAQLDVLPIWRLGLRGDLQDEALAAPPAGRARLRDYLIPSSVQ